MEKYKVCPHCGKHNPPKMLECIQCETDLSNVRVGDEETETKPDIIAVDSKNSQMVRICDCGFHNPVNARKCASCGEDISDIVPTEKIAEDAVTENHCVLASLDGEYAYELKSISSVMGREADMSDYLSEKLYVSRQHAELISESGRFFIKNLSQTNYTYVNNVKIPQEKFEIHDGDEIGLGGNSVSGNRQDSAAYFQVRIGSCI